MAENRTKYQTKYKRENYKRVPLEVRPADYALIKKCAEKHGLSVNGYIKQSIYNSLLHDLTGTDDEPELVRVWGSLNPQ